VFHGPKGSRGELPSGPVEVRPQNVRRLLGYLRPFRLRLVSVFAFTLVNTGVGLITPYLMKLAIDDSIAKGNIRGLHVIGLAIMVSYLISWLSAGQQHYGMAWVGQNALNALRQDLFKKLQRLSLSFFDRREAGDLMSRLVNDVDTISELLSSGVVSVFSDTLVLLGVVAIMLLMNAQLAVWSFAVLPLMALATAFFTSRMRRAYRITREKMGAVSAELQENISSIRVVQSFAREEETLQEFKAVNRDNRDANVRATRLAATFWPVVDILGTLASVIVMGVGGYLVIRGGVTVGIIVAFLEYTDRFFRPIRNLSQIYTQFQSAMAGANRVFDIMDTSTAVPPPIRPLTANTIQGRIEFDHVFFAYEDEQYVLRDISFTADPGETVAIVGPTGAGKTTIASLMPRFYDVSKGRVLIDGQDVRNYDLASLRRQIGIVLQESFLFSGTIAENIRYGRLDATDEEVIAAAQAANAHAFIDRLPQGYDTVLTERGSNLSLGQRQLLAFARALLADPRILILDEATANVDTRTERAIQEAMLRLLKGRTAIVIAHRLSTIRNADKVLVMKEGEIVERGTHRELLRQRGFYYDLYTMQFRRLVTQEQVREPIGSPHGQA